MHPFTTIDLIVTAAILSIGLLGIFFFEMRELKRQKKLNKYPKPGKVIYPKEVDRLLTPDEFDEHELKIS